MDENRDRAKLNRRDALKLIFASAGASAISLNQLSGKDSDTASDRAERLKGYSATDPDMINPIVPWNPVLNKDEMALVSALSDIIIPEDEHSPSASAVGVPEFINEWVSAPYDKHKRHLVAVQGGLSWLNAESERRFKQIFISLSEEEQINIVDDICDIAKASPERKSAAHFFDLMRNLTAAGFYTTEEGNKDVQYIGNTPMPEFKGPPPELLEKLGLSDL